MNIETFEIIARDYPIIRTNRVCNEFIIYLYCKQKIKQYSLRVCHSNPYISSILKRFSQVYNHFEFMCMVYLSMVWYEVILGHGIVFLWCIMEKRTNVLTWYGMKL